MINDEIKKLLDYYHSCFELIDVFHFNSFIAKQQYEAALGIKDFDYKTIPITLKSISDNRRKKTFDSSILNLGFIGSESPYKGLPTLKKVLSKIDFSSWKLNVWGGRIAKDDKLPIFYRGKFDTHNISNVYNDVDLLVVPSIWKETFSLVTLEALSYGVPVLVSKNVGAQDIVKKYDQSFVYNDEEDLLLKLKDIIENREKLKLYNNAIIEKEWEYDMLSHTKKIITNLYSN